MNANQILSMIMRMVMRKLVHRGVNAGIGMMSKDDTAGRGSRQPNTGQAKSNHKQTAKSAMRTARMLRRLTR